MKAELKAAALHLLQGTITAAAKEISGGVPPGHHALNNYQVTFVFPPHASVDRAAGSNGDGTNDSDPPKLVLTMNAVLLFMDNRGRFPNLSLQEAWVQAIQDDLRGMKVEAPAQAIEALAVVQESQPPSAPVKTKTPAKRTGEKEVAIEFKRLTAKQKTAGKKSAA